jgi:hypothetical protein
MASFARIAAAVDQVMGTNGLARYREMVTDQLTQAAEGDLLVTVLDRYLASKQADEASRAGVFIGTATELHRALREAAVEDERRDLPKTVAALGSAIDRVAPPLRLRGWRIDKSRASRSRLLRIERVRGNDPQSAVIAVTRHQPNSGSVGSPQNLPSSHAQVRASDDGSDGMTEAIPDDSAAGNLFDQVGGLAGVDPLDGATS